MCATYSCQPSDATTAAPAIMRELSSELSLPRKLLHVPHRKLPRLVPFFQCAEYSPQLCAPRAQQRRVRRPVSHIERSRPSRPVSSALAACHAPLVFYLSHSRYFSLLSCLSLSRTERSPSCSRFLLPHGGVTILTTPPAASSVLIGRCAIVSSRPEIPHMERTGRAEV